jgi:hypothetical protein
MSTGLPNRFLRGVRGDFEIACRFVPTLVVQIYEDSAGSSNQHTLYSVGFRSVLCMLKNRFIESVTFDLNI